ncbi:hypothetical protein WH47_03734, partial [Habropoda laboriosa]
EREQATSLGDFAHRREREREWMGGDRREAEKGEGKRSFSRRFLEERRAQAWLRADMPGYEREKMMRRRVAPAFYLVRSFPPTGAQLPYHVTAAPTNQSRSQPATMMDSAARMQHVSGAARTAAAGALTSFRPIPQRRLSSTIYDTPSLSTIFAPLSLNYSLSARTLDTFPSASNVLDRFVKKKKRRKSNRRSDAIVSSITSTMENFQ